MNVDLLRRRNLPPSAATVRTAAADCAIDGAAWTRNYYLLCAMKSNNLYGVERWLALSFEAHKITMRERSAAA